MEEARVEWPSDPVLAEEFRLWRAALVAHGHVLPDGQAGPAAGKTSPPLRPPSGGKPTRPPAGRTDRPSAPGRQGDQRRRWPAAVFVGMLVLGVLAAGYGNFSARQSPVRRSSFATPALASSPGASVPPGEREQREAGLADNVSHAGDALTLSGDPAGALRLYRQSLSIRRELAARRPGDGMALRALADAWDKVADTLAAQGDTIRALGTYREAEAAWQRCAHALPGDRSVQRSWSLTALSLGNLLLASNDPAGAVEPLQRGASLQETLCQQEPNNAAWQADQALVWLRLSDALDQRGDDTAALRACRRAVALDEALTARDAKNLLWQSDLATARARAGDLLLARNEVDAALMEFTAAASHRESLAAADATPERRRALADIKDRIGQALEIEKQPSAAVPLYRQALGIVAALSVEGAVDPALESLRAAVCFHLGRASAACHPPDREAARAALREARDRLAGLQSADGEAFGKEQALMLAAVEQSLAQLDEQPSAGSPR